jgi:uncharacterized protein
MLEGIIVFSQMRNIDQQLSEDENREILKRGEYGVLATLSQNGYPYTTPLNYVFYNDCIYFHSAVDGEKIRNIEALDKVSFCITCDVAILPDKFDTYYKSVVVFGRAKEIFNDEKKNALLAFIEKYSSQFIEQGKKYIEGSIDKTRVFKISIVHSTGKQPS